MTILFQLLVILSLIARYTALSAVSINWAETMRYRTMVLVVDPTVESPWNEVIRTCGGYLNMVWGGYLPVILHSSAVEGIPAIMFHEVGHKPDLMKIAKAYGWKMRMVTLIVHLVSDPINAPEWVVKLVKKAGGSVGDVIMLDHEMEMVADRYSAERVGKDVLHAAIMGQLSLMFDKPQDEVMVLLKEHEESSAGVQSLLKRLDALQ